ncbi:MAG: hypothetical protein M3131_04875, partial [Actinomycetota bacterium]|nr:hypothetical protein [Actinomycetota bacterium]
PGPRRAASRESATAGDVAQQRQPDLRADRQRRLLKPPARLRTDGDAPVSRSPFETLVRSRDA